MILTVYTNHGAVVGNYDVKNTAHLLDLQEEDVKWAIEQFGRCDSIDGVAYPFGERFERYNEWYAKQPR
jgi:hypothetical protein